jgi:hypothetical protein
MEGSFRQEDIDRVSMHPTQGFEPLVSVVLDDLKFFCFQIPSNNSVEVRAQDLSAVFFCFQIPSNNSVEVRAQDLSAVKETQRPLPEDRVAREARRLLAAQKKEKKDATKKRQVCKALEQEALKKRRRQQSLDGLPLEVSPSEMVSGENDDDGDDLTPGHGTTPQLL